MFKPIRAMLLPILVALAATGSTSDGAGMDRIGMVAHAMPSDGRLTVMTYNVKGLPWPVATGRAEAIDRITDRLASLRREGRQPRVVLLQEAFTTDAATIAARAGYAHAAHGPDPMEVSGLRGSPDDLNYLADARWDRGERIGKQLGSGLMILSDYPITATDRMTYPDFACAGFDCLANKGVLIAHVKVPGLARPVSVVNTHLNARTAAGVSIARSNHAFTRQVQLMVDFIVAHVPADRGLIVGGDMNIGKDKQRAAQFFGQFAAAGLGFVRPYLDGAHLAMAQSACGDAANQRDLASSSKRAKDWLFARNADHRPMSVAAASVPFGTERTGPPLSDHYGYAIEYRPVVPHRFRSQPDAGTAL